MLHFGIKIVMEHKHYYNLDMLCPPGYCILIFWSLPGDSILEGGETLKGGVYWIKYIIGVHSWALGLIMWSSMLLVDYEVSSFSRIFPPLCCSVSSWVQSQQAKDYVPKSLKPNQNKPLLRSLWQILLSQWWKVSRTTYFYFLLISFKQ